MASINDLGLIDEEIPVDITNLPSEGGSFSAVPLPGFHLFELPQNLTGVHNTVVTAKGQRLAAEFYDENMLRVVDLGGQQFRTRITNEERPRGKDKILGSAYAYLLRALGFTGSLTNSKSYADALETFGGKTFKAKVTWTATCSPTRKVYKDNKVQEDQFGCGTRYAEEGYTRKDGIQVEDIPRDDTGNFHSDFTCGGDDGGCGALLRVFANLQEFKGVKK